MTLLARGPLGDFRFPRYYMDVRGTRLSLMTTLGDPLTPAVADELPDPASPVSLSNFFGESFYYLCNARIDLPGGGTALLVGAIEGVFATPDESVEDGKQFVFSRLRWRIDTPVPGTYTVEHPWGTKVFENAPAGARGINHTEDALHLPNDKVTVTPQAVEVHDASAWFDTPLDPALATLDTFCGWDTPDAPEGYIGDPRTLHTIRASAKGFNHFKITGPDGAFGPGVNAVSTTLFSVAGKKWGYPDVISSLESSVEYVEFDVEGTAAPRATVTVTNADGQILAQGVAGNDGTWRIRQKFVRDAPLYPQPGTILTVTADNGDTVTFTFVDEGPAAPIVGTGSLTVTDFGTTLPLIPAPAPVPGQANFIGQPGHLGGLAVSFPDTPPVDGNADMDTVVLNDVPRALVTNTGPTFGTSIGDALPIDLFTLRLSNAANQLVNEYSAEVVAVQDPNDPTPGAVSPTIKTTKYPAGQKAAFRSK